MISVLLYIPEKSFVELKKLSLNYRNFSIDIRPKKHLFNLNIIHFFLFDSKKYFFVSKENLYIKVIFKLVSSAQARAPLVMWISKVFLWLKEINSFLFLITDCKEIILFNFS